VIEGWKWRETKNTIFANLHFTERNYSCYCSSIMFSKHFLDISIRFQVRTIKTSKHCALASYRLKPQENLNSKNVHKLCLPLRLMKSKECLKYFIYYIDNKFTSKCHLVSPSVMKGSNNLHISFPILKLCFPPVCFMHINNQYELDEIFHNLISMSHFK